MNNHPLWYSPYEYVTDQGTARREAKLKPVLAALE
jgi:hypothetical protein